MFETLFDLYFHAWSEHRATIQNRIEQNESDHLDLLSRLSSKFIDFLRQSYELALIFLILSRGAILRVGRFVKKIDGINMAAEFNICRHKLLMSFIQEDALPNSPLLKFFWAIDKAQCWATGIVDDIATIGHIAALGQLINILSDKTHSYNSDSQRIKVASTFIHHIILERFYQLPLQNIQQFLLNVSSDKSRAKTDLQAHLLYCLSSRSLEEFEARSDVTHYDKAIKSLALHEVTVGLTDCLIKPEHRNQFLMLSFFDTYQFDAKNEASPQDLEALAETLKDGIFIGSAQDWQEHDKAEKQALLLSQTEKKFDEPLIDPINRPLA